MGSKQDLSDQLELTTKLAAQVERMSAAAEKAAAAYQSQLETMTKLADAFSKVNTSDVVKNVEAVTKALGDLQAKMKDTSEVSQETMKKIGKSISPLGDAVKMLPGTLDRFIASLQKLDKIDAFKSIIDDIQKLSTIFSVFDDDSKPLVDHVNKFVESLQKIGKVDFFKDMVAEAHNMSAIFKAIKNDNEPLLKYIDELVDRFEKLNKELLDIGKADLFKGLLKGTIVENVEKLSKTFKTLDVEPLIAQIEKLRNAFKKTDDVSDVSKKVNDLSSSLNNVKSSSGTVGDAATSQKDQLAAISLGIEGINSVLKLMLTKMGGVGKTSSSTFSKLGKGIDTTSDKFGKFPKSAAIATAALSGFAQGVRNIVSLGSSVGGFFSTFVSGLVNVAASVIAIPFKIFEGLVDMAARAGGSTELAQALEDLRKQFGAFYAPTNKSVINLSKTMDKFSQTGLSAWRVYGNMAERLNYLREMATEMGASFNLLRREIEDNGRAVLDYRKGLGLSSEQMKAITQKSEMMGVNSTDTMKDMTKYSYAMAKAFKLDAKVISREMGEAMKDMAHFGTTSTRNLSESITFAHKFGLELKDITGTLDKFDSFDDAAEHVANLSQAFGVNIDSFQMMKASAEGDVGKQTEILRKAFREQGVDASKFNNVQRALIRDNTGMSDAAIQAAFSLKQQGVALSDVQKVGTAAQKNTMTQEQAMKTLADAIERLVKAGEPMKGSYWDNFFDGFLNGIQGSKEFHSIMREINMQLRQVFRYGVMAGRAFVQFFPGVAEMGRGIYDAFKPIPIFFKNFKENLGSLFKGNISLSNFAGNVKEQVEILMDAAKGPFSTIVSGFKKFMTKTSELAGSAVKFLVKHLTIALKEGTEFLKDPKKYLNGAIASGNSGLSFMQEVLKPLIDAIKDPAMWEGLFNAFKGFAGQLWVLTKKAMTWVLGQIPSDFWAGLGVILFAPAALRSLVAVGITVMGGAVKDIFSSVVKGAAGTAEKIGSSSGSVISKVVGSLFGNPVVIAAAAVATLTVAGLAMSDGIIDFKEKISKDIKDDNDRTIGAATAGLVQTLSFGSIDKEAAQNMAENFAKYSEKFTKTINNLFGENFGKDIKDTITNNFESLIDIGDLFKSIVGGDANKIKDSFGKVLFDIAKGGILFLKLQIVTIPEKLSEWLSDGVKFLADWLDKLFQPGGADGVSVTDKLISGISSMGEKVLPLISDIPGRLLSIFGQKIIPTILRLVGSIGGIFFRIPGIIVESLQKLIDEGGIANRYIVEPLRQALFDAGNFIPYAGKFLGDAISNVVAYIKAKVSGGDTSKIDIFPKENFADYKKNLSATTANVVSANADATKAVMNASELMTQRATAEKFAIWPSTNGIEKGFFDYKSSLNTTTDNVISANNSASEKVAAASSKLTEKADVGSFLYSAAKTTESINKLNENLAKISDKDLEKLKTSFNKVLSTFGNEKDLATNVAKVTNISEAFKALSVIATSAVSFREKFDKVGDITTPLTNATGIIDSVTKWASTPSYKFSESDIANIALITKEFDGIGDLGTSFTKMSANIMKATANITKDGVTPALEAIGKMVAAVNQLNTAMADPGINTINLKARLENVAKAVGLGGKASYSVDTGKGVQIVVNMHVTMDAGNVEKAILYNSTSIIRDRLNFATSQPTEKGADIITAGGGHSKEIQSFPK